MTMETPRRTVAEPADRLDFTDRTVRTFAHLLVNVLLVSFINYTVWFGITFFVYLQTRSVFATGMIAGIFLVAMAGTGVWFGSIVDHHRKKSVMQVSALVSLGIYAVALVCYVITPAEVWRDPASVRLWMFVVLAMTGVIAGSLRTIALPTMVTAMFDERVRDRANGLVGTTTGVSHLITSVASALLVGWNGMLGVLVLAVVVPAVAVVHLRGLTLPESLAHAAAAGEPQRVDLRGTVRVIRAIPGMIPLIVFSALNNLLFGGLMALMDPYALSMMSVQAWGVVWGVLSGVMIIGGLLVARTGTSSNPVRLILLVNLALWAVMLVFPIQDSVLLLIGGMAVFMVLMPFAEAAEQTVLQKVVPYQRQGRVFGFAQSVEQAASPLTAFLLSPLTQFFFIPFMTDGAGARRIGSWFGTGEARGMALVFVLLGILGLLFTGFALGSSYYRRLSRSFRQGGAAAGPQPGSEPIIEQTVPEKDSELLAPGAATGDPRPVLCPQSAG
ncbi:MFS transporter [Nocardia jinanensis]|uniref:Multidrug resistance protein n=1 Tax=Nocardia jinanensis TaxID=382504 RepID=A0A917VJK6_9NOCA|nr:MFS transporter [Nocardia jinanensis]GGK91288.1 multidrug resistance protein [Nocardia jinanensis]